jgi:hypothetical protein
MTGLDLAEGGHGDKSYDWDQTEWQLGTGYGQLRTRSTTWSPSTTA